MALLEVKNLQVSFDTPEGEVHAVNGIDFAVGAGETLAIVGESGSGKSQLVMAIMGLLARNGSASGQALFKGEDLLRKIPRELNRVRGSQIAMIFQDPMTSLNPYLTVEQQMTEVVMYHRKLSHREALGQAVEMLRAVRIPDPEERIHQYPHEYSGGMRQRVMIAMSLLCEPDLLIADEPTTALDVTVQAQIAFLIGELRKKTRMAMILITHDMAVVAGICDRIVVMYAGQMVESGTVDDIFYHAHHPYTRGLLASVPRLDRDAADDLHAIPGNPPNLLALPRGCSFRDRCAQAQESCARPPPIWSTERGHRSRCVLEMRDGRVEEGSSGETEVATQEGAP
jgi:oligopeptide transport system ATP-binding protein